MGYCARPFNLTGYPDGNIVLCCSWWYYLTPLDGLLLLVILIWGSNFSLVKTAIEEIPTFGFNTLRMATACLVLLTVSRLNGEAAPDRGDWPRLITLGFFGHCWYRLAFVTGLERTTVANSSLILGCMPIAVMVLNALSGRLEGCGNCQRFGVGFAVARSLRRRTFAAQYGSPAHALSFVSGRLRRSAERGRFSAVGEQEAEFSP